MGNNGEVVKVKDNLMRGLLALIVGIGTFLSHEVVDHKKLIAEHTERITAIEKSEVDLKKDLNSRLDRIERKQDDLFRELLKR